MPDTLPQVSIENANRHILFLQGPSSPFFAKLAKVLAENGAFVRRIGTCPGDRLFWPKSAGPYVPYRGKAADIGECVRAQIDSHGITDLVCLGDGREIHAAAIAVARTRGVAIWVIEHGYLRPGWITVEPNGTGGRSRIPQIYGTTPQRFDLPPKPPAFRSSFLEYAGFDVAYHASNFLAPLFYPNYRHHALHTPLQEWRGWIGKAVTKPARNKACRAALEQIAAHAGDLFVLPLQLETDYQIRHHAPRDMHSLTQEVIASFSQNTPKTALLVVKQHPLDNGLARWGRRVAEMAQAQGCGDRVVFLDGGDLDALLRRARGCVTINSTVGLTALGLNIPVKVLGRAIYDRMRLTCPKPLSEFWKNPTTPDRNDVMEFENFLKHEIMVPGAFDGTGADIGAANVAARILAGVPGHSP